ncbi:putative NTPase (NACHT family) [Leptolyngbya sp. PCC 7375]|nr:putative NTPase (NACHT family) [Leptolyngbya sp. PCC 7375]
MLTAITTEVQERLKQSFHNTIRLNLHIEQQDYRVQRPWTITSANSSQSVEFLGNSKRIEDVFYHPEIAQQLLVLGEPGAGKTTMLLELAQDLLKRARSDREKPIPILINLSSWKDPEQPVFDWLVIELKEKYGIRQDLSRKWLKCNQLLPLLDGLDEVVPQHQQNCASAINTWLTGELEERPCGLVVCCRREEFEKLVQPSLNLYGSVYLKPLTITEIENYFSRLDLRDIWENVQQDKSLLDLLKTPLFLSMFSLAEKQELFSITSWELLKTTDVKIEYLLDVYWEAVINRELIIDPHKRQQGIFSKTYGKNKLPKSENIKRALIFVAKALEKESKTELFIERMQPSWLPKEEQRTMYKNIFMIFLTSFFMLWSVVGQKVSTELSLLITTFPWLKYFLSMNEITPTERLQFSNLEFVIKNYRPFIHISLSIISILTVLLARLSNNADSGWPIFIFIVLSGVVINMSISSLFESMKAEIALPLEANQGIKNSWKNIPFLVISAFLLIGFLYLRFNIGIGILLDDSFSLLVIISYVLYIAIFAAFEGGGRALIQHFSLRLILAWNRYAPPRYDLLLDYCTELLLLQRVGGRYRFMHRLLQEYFSKMELK